MNEAPAHWQRVIGQSRSVDFVRALLRNDRVPSAWLFTGPSGVGKAAVAIEVARVLRCEVRPSADLACGCCTSCAEIDELRHAGLLFTTALPTGKNENGRNDGPLDRLSSDDLSVVQEEIQKKGHDPYHRLSIPKARGIKVSSVREIRRQLSRASDDKRRRIVILHEADTMGPSAANAFLKTLEEPGEATTIILTSSHPERLLPTVRSRCQVFAFAPISPSDMSEALVSRWGADQTTAGLVSHLAEGSLERARDLLNEDFRLERMEVVSFFRNVLRRSPEAAHEAINRLLAAGDRLVLGRMIGLLGLWFRDLLVLRSGGGDRVINRDQADDLRSFNEKFSAVDPALLIAEVERTRTALQNNATPQLLMIHFAHRISEICHAMPASGIGGSGGPA